MGPDWFWIAMFSLGGVAIGLVTSLVGLGKGREFYGWMALYIFMIVVVTALDLARPFWAILAASIIAGALASAVEVTLMGAYRRHNPWAASEFDHPPKHVAASFFTYSMAASAVFGLVMGTLGLGVASLG
jgi:hypothetical protein